MTKKVQVPAYINWPVRLTKISAPGDDPNWTEKNEAAGRLLGQHIYESCPVAVWRGLSDYISLKLQRKNRP